VLSERALNRAERAGQAVPSSSARIAPLGRQPHRVDQDGLAVEGDQLGARERPADGAVSDAPVPDAVDDLGKSGGGLGGLGHRVLLGRRM